MCGKDTTYDYHPNANLDEEFHENIRSCIFLRTSHRIIRDLRVQRKILMSECQSFKESSMVEDMSIPEL